MKLGRRLGQLRRQARSLHFQTGDLRFERAVAVEADRGRGVDRLDDIGHDGAPGERLGGEAGGGARQARHEGRRGGGLVVVAGEDCQAERLARPGGRDAIAHSDQDRR